MKRADKHTHDDLDFTDIEEDLDSAVEFGVNDLIMVKSYGEHHDMCGKVQRIGRKYAIVHFKNDTFAKVLAQDLLAIDPEEYKYLG